ncbi:hypothetical protein GCM10007857_45640 [Bradyrhizobium iriomotense]|uniref:Uncharacterized protein n=1 Tax=Bradyrhizobium iriomotense TaxID=441950 RepID=A0ABQ6B0D3_9BRAD|nr:hypothetical protein GCM10007857_45640 [Bradyrhizobium iriomotense]
MKEGFGQPDDEFKEEFEDGAGQIIEDEVEQDLHAHSPSCRPIHRSSLELDVGISDAGQQQRALHLSGNTP